MIKQFAFYISCAILLVSCNIDDDANRNAGLNINDNDQMSSDDMSDPGASANATYVVRFIGEWTPESHPTDFPNNDHFSRTILITHSNDVSLFTEGQLASNGIEDMSEIGDNENLKLEMQAFIDAGEANQYLVGPGSIPGNGTDELIIEATQNASKLSYVAMIAPSPDWFTGLSGISLFENSEWVESIEINVQAYDAGTEEGVEFRYDNADTSPQQPISKITEAPLGNGTGVSPSLGRLVITLQQ